MGHRSIQMSKYSHNYIMFRNLAGGDSLKAIIMAGGQGTRFWPLSVDEQPKQFQKIYLDKTLIQLTYERFRTWLPSSKIFVVTTSEYVSLVMEQLPDLLKENIIVEPYQRDTGPCIALTANFFLKQKDDEVLVVSPSDQYISDNNKFKDALISAEQVAEIGTTIVTLGISPTRPETGYGYINANLSVAANNKKCLKVNNFIEKPSLEKAKELFHRENIYWNSGIFIWKPSTIAYYMNKEHPEIWGSLINNLENLENVYSTFPRLSVDYAILEKAKDIYTIPVDFKWDDLGTWTSLERIHEYDKFKNVILGDIHVTSTKNSIIFSEDKTVLVVGMEDVIVVTTNDGVLVCNKSFEQQVKEAVKKMLENKDCGEK